jgi:tetratricopeptide (TPR) repeat protein
MRGNSGGKDNGLPGALRRRTATFADWRAKIIFATAFFVFTMVHLRASGSLEVEFEQANKFYEQDKFKEAAAAYQVLAERGVESPAIYFNLGNAWYKTGQNGRAIAAYLRAERLAPHDPNIRFNLAFVRQKVNAGSLSTGTLLQRGLRYYSVNEWTIAAVCAFWLFLLLLAVTELRPTWRTNLRNAIIGAGALALLLALGMFGALFDRGQVRPAVVIIPEATVRYGPLEESRPFYTLRDGAEVRLLEEPKNSWVKIEDATGRQGWLKRDQLLPVFPKRGRA